MAYEQDITVALQFVFDDADIKSALDTQPAFNRAFITHALNERSAAIFEEAKPQIAEFESVERDVVQRQNVVYAAYALPRDVTLAIATGSVTFMVIVVVSIIDIFAKWNLAGAWQSITERSAIWIPLTVFFAWLVVVEPIRAFIFNWARPAVEQRLRTRLDLDAKEAQLKAVRAAADAAVLAAAIQTAKRVINDASWDVFQDRLVVAGTESGLDQTERVTSGTGLAETLNPANEVTTDVKRRVLGMLANLPGASIGIAGPRGVGKSTLLESVCGSNPTIRGVEALGVYTSAPVEYEPRDFLLHLFAAVCGQVLKTKGVSDDRSMEHADGSDVTSPDTRKIFARIAEVLIVFGALASVVGLGIADLQQRDAVASQRAAASQPAIQRSAAAGAPAPAPPTLLSTLDLKPGAMLTWGVLALLTGIVARVGAHWLYGSELFYFHWKRIAPTFEDYKGELVFRRRDRDRLVRLCQERLRDIRFQRSFSSGWSGSLSVLAGAGLTINRARSIAQNQLSLPDIVERFRDLLQVITSSPYERVVIAIDELDKLQSDEKAQTFVNEIKAVFNVPSCFFLVSVSENAMSSFERRGLRFRDAFDSAFDDIVYVGYLKPTSSKALLDRRVVNLPFNYHALCHAVSGGLPRDLIRVTRTLLEIAEASAKPTMRNCCHELVAREIASKVRATRFAVGVRAVEPEGTLLQAWLARLEDKPVLTPAFRRAALGAVELLARSNVTDEERTAIRSLVDLFEELQTFVAYAMTIAEVFDSIDASVVQSRLDERAESLAEIRQGLEISTAVAKSRIVTNRANAGLDALWPPAA